LYKWAKTDVLFAEVIRKIFFMTFQCKLLIVDKQLKIFLTSCFLLAPLFVVTLLAQAPPPAPANGNSAPIQGLGILAALGVMWGINKLRDKKK